MTPLQSAKSGQRGMCNRDVRLAFFFLLLFIISLFLLLYLPLGVEKLSLVRFIPWPRAAASLRMAPIRTLVWLSPTSSAGSGGGGVASLLFVPLIVSGRGAVTPGNLNLRDFLAALGSLSVRTVRRGCHRWPTCFFALK